MMIARINVQIEMRRNPVAFTFDVLDRIGSKVRNRALKMKKQVVSTDRISMTRSLRKVGGVERAVPLGRIAQNNPRLTIDVMITEMTPAGLPLGIKPLR